MIRLHDGGGQLTDAELKKAVVLGWITAGQYKTITGEDYSA